MVVNKLIGAFQHCIDAMMDHRMWMYGCTPCLPVGAQIARGSWRPKVSNDLQRLEKGVLPATFVGGWLMCDRQARLCSPGGGCLLYPTQHKLEPWLGTVQETPLYTLGQVEVAHCQ